MAISSDPNDPNFGLETDQASPNFGLPAQEEPSGVGTALKHAGEALVETVKGFIPTTPKAIAEFATPVVGGVESVVKSGRALYDVAFGGKGISETEAKYFPESQVFVEAEKTPPFSKERFAAGFGTLGQIAMGGLLFKSVGKPLLKEITSGERIAPGAMPQTPEPPIPETVPPITPETTNRRILTDLNDEQVMDIYHDLRSRYANNPTEALDARIEQIGNELAHRSGLQEGTAFGTRGFRPVEAQSTEEVIPNAVQEQGPSSVLPHPQEAVGEAGGERVGVGQGVQGEEIAQARPEAEAVTSVPVMITKRMEADLQSRGFTQEEINAMTPQEAHANLQVEPAAPVPQPEQPTKLLTQEELFKVSDDLAKQHDEILMNQGIEAADKFAESHPLLQYGSADYLELIKIGKAPEEPALGGGAESRRTTASGDLPMGVKALKGAGSTGKTSQEAGVSYPTIEGVAPLPPKTSPVPEAEAPTTAAPPPVETPPTPAEAPVQKPSKIGQSIEAKAVEAKLTEGFSETAGYDPISIADQAQRATSFVKSSPDAARAVVRGEAPLPEGLRGTSLITAMEEQLLKKPDAQLAYELANSPLTSATSAAAQEMRLMSERVPDSLSAKFNEIRRAREAGSKLRGETPESVFQDIKKEIVRQSSKRPRWEEFVRSIEC